MESNLDLTLLNSLMFKSTLSRLFSKNNFELNVSNIKDLKSPVILYSQFSGNISYSPEEQNSLNNQSKYQESNTETSLNAVGTSHSTKSIPSIQKNSDSYEFNPRNSVLSLSTTCIICDSNRDILAFLCNENLCKLCISTFACKEIISYCIRINTSVAAERKFEYHCAKCGNIISLPTKMVIKYYLEYAGQDLNEEMRWFLQDISKNYLPLFDGLENYLV